MESWTSDGWLRRDFWISEPDTTNNRMALRSAIESMAGLKRRCRVRFVSDSQYLVKGMAEWLPNWKARGWKRKGGPIENLALWQRLDEAARRHEVEWTWVKGHAGHPKNEYANDLAVRAAELQDTSGGFTESGFEAWLKKQRHEKARYLEFSELAPPNEAARGAETESG